MLQIWARFPMWLLLYTCRQNSGWSNIGDQSLTMLFRLQRGTPLYGMSQWSFQDIEIFVFLLLSIEITDRLDVACMYHFSTVQK